MNPETTCTLDTPEIDMAEDRRLNARIAQGDDRAFAQLVARYSGPVYRFLARMVGSNEDAKDLTQDTFLAFHKHHRTLRTDVDIHPYLFTIARRKAISFLRWRNVRRVLVPFQTEHEEIPVRSEISPVDSLEQLRREEMVQECLNDLHPEKRAVLILRFFENLSYPKIAQVMNKPEGTVKSLVYRGEEELRKRLERRLKPERGES